MRIKEGFCHEKRANTPGAIKVLGGGTPENRNRLQFSLRCGSRLGVEKNVSTREKRFACRLRICASCGAGYCTKQGPEEFYGFEVE